MRLVASNLPINPTDHAFDTVDRTSCGNGVLSSFLGGGSGVIGTRAGGTDFRALSNFLERAGILLKRAGTA